MFNLQKIVNQNVQTYQLSSCLWAEIVVIKGEGKIDEFPIKTYDAMISTNKNCEFVLSGNLSVLVNCVQKQ